MRRVVNNIKNHSNWFSYYVYKYRGRHDEFTFQTRSGLRITVPKRLMHTYKECFFDETYTKGLPEDLSNKQFKNVIDIGANVGYFSLYMLSRNPQAQLYSFEPIPFNFKQLNRYKSDNSDLSFNIFNEAVSKPGQSSISLHFKEEQDSFTTSASVFEDSKGKNKLIVKTSSLEDIIILNELNQIDFLKVDCEGAEYEILYNTPSKVFDIISVIAVETHEGSNENENTHALSDFLIKKGYQLNIKGDIIWAWK